MLATVDPTGRVRVPVENIDRGNAGRGRMRSHAAAAYAHLDFVYFQTTYSRALFDNKQRRVLLRDHINQHDLFALYCRNICILYHIMLPYALLPLLNRTMCL